MEVEATAYFDGYRLKDYLTLDETRGYLAVQDRVEKGEAVVSGEDFGTVTLSLSSGSASVRVQTEGMEAPLFQIKVEVKADISAISGGRNRMEQQFYEKLEERVAGDVKQEIEAAVRKTVLEDRCDIFGFGNLLYRKQPGYWRGVSNSWKELMAQCRYEIQVNARVLRIEQETLQPNGAL